MLLTAVVLVVNFLIDLSYRFLDPRIRSTRVRRRVPPTLLAGGLLVGLVILTALVSVVWTPADPTPRRGRRPLEGPSAGVPARHRPGRPRRAQPTHGRRDQHAGHRHRHRADRARRGRAAGRPGRAVSRPARRRDHAPERRAARVSRPSCWRILFAAVFQPSRFTAMAAIGIALVPVFARVVRGAGLQVMQQDYVTIVRTYGGSNAWIFVRHLLPNVSSVLIVQATVAFAVAILAEAALSYLGPGHAAADAVVGPHAERVADVSESGAAAGGLARRRDRPVGPRLQPARRRPARPARSQAGRTRPAQAMSQPVARRRGSDRPRRSIEAVHGSASPSRPASGRG